MLGLNYGPAADPLAALGRPDCGADLGLRAQPRLSRRPQGQAEGARCVHRRGGAAGQGGREGVRRHGAADGEAARGARGARLAGQAHQSRLARIRLLAVSGRDPDRPRPSARSAGGGPLRTMPRLPRRLSDGRVSRALPARRAQMHFLFNDRAQRPDSTGVSSGDGKPHLRLRRLPRRLPVEQVCERSGGKRNSLRAPISTRRRFAELARLDEASFRSRFAGGPIKRIGRARFVRNVMIAIGNSKDRTLGPVAAERLEDEDPLVRGAAVWALGRLVSAEELSRFASKRMRREDDPAVIEEWRDALAAPPGRTTAC